MRLDRGMLQPVGNLTVGGNVTIGGTLAVTGATTTAGITTSTTANIAGLILSGAFRPSATSSTIDYTSVTTDRVIAMNVTAGGTLTLVASPSTSQTYLIYNRSGNALTITAQGSHTINGGSAAGSVTVAAGASCWAHYLTTNVWLISEAGPA